MANTEDIDYIRKQSVRHAMPLYGKWNVLLENRSGWYLDKGDAGLDRQTPEDVKHWKMLLTQYEKNRLSFFLPHGPIVGVDGKPHGTYKNDLGESLHVTEGHVFISDQENDICIITAPTRTGKSAAGNAFCLYRVLKCKPNWHCFKNHGIQHWEYRGQRRLVISSYEWVNVQELWHEYMHWIPRELLGNYAPEWGKFPGETGKQRYINLKTGNVSHVKLSDGTVILFRCDKQGQGPWEGQRWDDGHFDEQRQREKFIGYLRGTSNTPGMVQCCFTLTGHILDNRPDTGATGWIKNELWDGNYTFGRKIGRYHLDIESTPDVVLPPKRKEELYRQWVLEPKENQDVETLRKAEARYHGGWEWGSGAVVDNFDPFVHVIPNYDRDHRICRDTTKYRGIDHGLSRPCACVLGEVFPWGDIVIYKEYFHKEQTVPFHVVNIIKMCGNTRSTVGIYDDDSIVDARKTYAEHFVGTRFWRSVLDGRSFASPAQERNGTLGELYNQYGLWCTAAKCAKARGDGSNQQIENMKAYLKSQPERPHIMWQFHKRKMIAEEVYQNWLTEHKGNWKNGADLYFVDDLRETFREFRQWAMRNGRPEDANNHIVGGALKYLLAEKPRYFGSMWDDVDTDWDEMAEYESDDGFHFVKY